MRTPAHHRACVALLLVTIGLASTARATPQTITAMRDHRRVILIAQAHDNDPQAARQNAILMHWQKGADERDISVITITGSTVAGSADQAEPLRRRYRLSAGHFNVLLIGKDGHVAMRSGHPIAAGTLQNAIDAMPMRQAGQR